MALVGTPVGQQTVVTEEQLERFYSKNVMRPLAEQFLGVVKAGLNEQVDIFSEPSKFFMNPGLKHQMKNMFINESFDKNDPDMQSPQAIKEHTDAMNALFEHDLMGMMEAAPLGAFNPTVGITFPMHKNLLMTTVFDKGAIPKDVAAGPQFTLTMETRTLYSPIDNREIDMFLEQDKIKDIVESAVPRKEVVIALPEDQTTDVLGLLGAVNNGVSNISRSTRVVKLIVDQVWVEEGDEFYDTATQKIKKAAAGDVGLKQAVLTINPIHFVAAYGQYDRTFQQRIDMRVATAANAATTRNEIFQIAGSMHKNRFTFMCSSTNIKAVVLSAALDTSSASYDTPKVKWSARTDYFEIPDAPHITVTISPEETRDIQAMYNTNQLTKILSMIKLTLVNYKDDKILEKLDESFLNLPETSSISGAFNFVPDDNYMGSYVAWRYETFMDYLDTQVTYLLQVLNDENMTVSIFGRPELIRKISPKEYNYATPSSIGPVMLDYKKTVKTSDNRVYQFISSNKLRNDNNLIIILCPRNSTRVIYKIFDYQLYVGNDIRDTKNYQLPAVTAFERWLLVEYQPVQGRIQIVNPSGRREDIENKTPVDPNRALNDYTANKVGYRSDGNGGNQQYLHAELKPQSHTARSAINPSTLAPGQSPAAGQTTPHAVNPPNYATTHPSGTP